MTKNGAIEYEKQLKQFIAKEAEDMKISSDQIIQMIDKYVEIYPDKLTSMGMFDLGDNSRSIRPGNVCFNQRDFFIACVSLATSVAMPNTLWGYIALGLNCLIFTSSVVDTVTKEITENEAYIVSYLHMHNMYNQGLPENEFGDAFKTWYHEETGDDMSTQRMQKALGNLYRMESAEIIEGEIRLKEKVWRNNL